MDFGVLIALSMSPDVSSLWYWVNNLSPEPVWRWSWDANASILLWELDDVCGGHPLGISAPVPFLVISSPQADGTSGEGQGCPYEKGLNLLACESLVSHLSSFRKSHLPACPWAPPQSLLRSRNGTPNYLNARKQCCRHCEILSLLGAVHLGTPSLPSPCVSLVLAPCHRASSLVPCPSLWSSTTSWLSSCVLLPERHNTSRQLHGTCSHTSLISSPEVPHRD